MPVQEHAQALLNELLIAERQLQEQYDWAYLHNKPHLVDAYRAGMEHLAIKRSTLAALFPA